MIQPYITEKKLILYSTLKSVKSSVIWRDKTDSEKESPPKCAYDKIASRM